MTQATPKPPRVSVPLTADVLAVFERLSAVSGMSVGRSIAEWLKDTAPAAEKFADAVQVSRSMPKNSPDLIRPGRGVL